MRAALTFALGALAGAIVWGMVLTSTTPTYEYRVVQDGVTISSLFAEGWEPVVIGDRVPIVKRLRGRFR